MLGGVYELKKEEETVFMSISPEAGWHPYEKKISVNLLYYVNKDFKKWPTTYKWQAVIDTSDDAIKMNSEWERININ